MGSPDGPRHFLGFLHSPAFLALQSEVLRTEAKPYLQGAIAAGKTLKLYESLNLAATGNDFDLFTHYLAARLVEGAQYPLDQKTSNVDLKNTLADQQGLQTAREQINLAIETRKTRPLDHLPSALERAANYLFTLATEKARKRNDFSDFLTKKDLGIGNFEVSTWRRSFGFSAAS